MRGTLPRLQSCPSAPRSPHSSSAQTTPPRTWRCTDTDHMRQPEADAQPLPLPLPLNTLQAPVLHDAPVRAGAGGSLRPSSDDLRAAGGDASTKQASERESEASSARTRSAAPASPSPGRSRPGTSTTRPARRPRRGTAAAPWGFRSGPAQRQGQRESFFVSGSERVPSRRASGAVPALFFDSNGSSRQSLTLVPPPPPPPPPPVRLPAPPPCC